MKSTKTQLKQSFQQSNIKKPFKGFFNIESLKTRENNLYLLNNFIFKYNFVIKFFNCTFKNFSIIH